MKRIVVIIVLLVALAVPMPVLAWGSNTHLEIDKSISNSELFQQGSILPDMALGLHYAEGQLWTGTLPSNWQEIHTEFHTREFADLLWVSCEEHGVLEFAEGWVCHTLGSDSVESVKVTRGCFANSPFLWNGVN